MIRHIITPELPARRNLAITEALLRGDHEIFRQQRFSPSALIGAHQSLPREIDLDYCAANGIETARRLTGGGAITMGPGILGWELVLHRTRFPSLDAATETLCQAIATGLSRFAPARFRPRNDIVIDGRKIAGTGGYFDGNRLLFQGTVLVDPDLELMARALRLPDRKLSAGGGFAQRLTTLRAEWARLPTAELPADELPLTHLPDLATIGDALATALADALGTPRTPSTLTQAETTLATALHDNEIGTNAFVRGHHLHQAPAPHDRHASRATPSGLVEVALRLAAGRVQSIAIGGDIFVTPPRVLRDLEATLAGHPAIDAPDTARALFKRTNASLLGGDITLLADLIAEAVTALRGPTP